MSNDHAPQRILHALAWTISCAATELLTIADVGSVGWDTAARKINEAITALEAAGDALEASDG